MSFENDLEGDSSLNMTKTGRNDNDDRSAITTLMEYSTNTTSNLKSTPAIGVANFVFNSYDTESSDPCSDNSDTSGDSSFTRQGRSDSPLMGLPSAPFQKGDF